MPNYLSIYLSIYLSGATTAQGAAQGGDATGEAAGEEAAIAGGRLRRWGAISCVCSRAPHTAGPVQELDRWAVAGACALDLRHALSVCVRVSSPEDAHMYIKYF